MKKLILFIGTFLMFQYSFSQITHQWSYGLGADSVSDYVFSQCLDRSGNLLVTGYFHDTVDFDPGLDTFSLTANWSVAYKGFADSYLAKYDPQGNFISCLHFYSFNESDYGKDIAVDTSGNIYIVGAYAGCMDFNPDENSTLTQCGNGAFEAYVLKLDSNGNYLWHTIMSGTANDEAVSIEVMPDQSIVVAGIFNGTVDFNPGANVNNLVSAGQQDGFVASYSASGNYLWAFSIGSSTSDQINAIDVDANGNVIVTGYIKGTADFNPGSSTANLGTNGEEDAFLAKYDKSGNYKWAFSMGSTDIEEGETVKFSENGDVVVGGILYGATDFDPSANTVNLSPTSGSDGFIARYDSLGNYEWAINFATNVRSIDIDQLGNILAAGIYSGSTDFDPSSNQYLFSSTAGTTDIFMAEYDSSGNFDWAVGIGGTATDVPYSILYDHNGNFYVGGYFAKNIDADPGVDSSYYTSTNDDNMLIGKYRHYPDQPEINAVDTILCTDDNDSIALSVVGAKLNNAQNWYWYTGDCGTLLVDSGYSIWVSPLDTTTYFVRGEDEDIISGNCSNITIYVNTKPQVSLGNDTTVCEGEYVILSPGSGYDSYYWNTGSVNQSNLYQVDDTTIYIVWVTKNYCTNSDTVIVNANAKPKTSLGNDTTVCDTTAILLDAGPNFASYYWSTSDTTRFIEVTPSTSGIGAYTYWVQIEDLNGCSTIDSIQIVVTVCTQINQLSSHTNEISMYPNPFTSHFVLNSTDKIKSVFLYNIAGEKVMDAQHVNNFSASFSALQLEAGLYLISIQTEQTTKNYKIIKE